MQFARPSGFLLLILIMIGSSSGYAQNAPLILVQPRGRSVSIGAGATLRVTADGSPPLRFQWFQNNSAVPDGTSNVLALSNIQLKDAGSYTAVVANDSGSVTSAVAVLEVDPTFTKITAGAIATDGGDSSGCAWGDYDNDGYPDLFVGNGGTRNFLYHNNRDGTFTKATNAAPALTSGYGGSWADFDNDGFLDLFVADLGINYLHRNNGDGTFTRLTQFAGAAGMNSWSGSWADYDLDGAVDLFISNGAGNNNMLLQNNGDGTFTKVARQNIVSEGGASIGATWQDYDRDGSPDLYVANNGGRSFLYRNLRNGTFDRILSGRIGTDNQSAIVPDWGDYDNDGWPDLVVGCFGRSLLYRNLGDGTFDKQTNGPVVLDTQNSEIMLWADYDNDGYLDVFSANGGGQNNSLYHNEGNGTFRKITSGSIVNDGGNSAGAAWADYDNDGFLDLFVANWQGSRPNFLYRNNGNSNHWLRVKCAGTASNRSGIGAKVRVKARLRGTEIRQLREISGGTGFGQTPLLAHFGLADAAVAEAVTIEWPSGSVQEFRQVPADQTLDVIEPPRLRGASVSGGSFEVILIGAGGSNYVLESSDDLLHWSGRLVLTNSARSNRVNEALQAAWTRRFYRARSSD